MKALRSTLLTIALVAAAAAGLPRTDGKKVLGMPAMASIGSQTEIYEAALTFKTSM